MPKMQQKKKVKEWNFEPTPPPPKLPKEILNEFLERKCKISCMDNVTQVKAGFLFDKGGIERYRIDVWVSEEIPHMFTRRHFISHSWYVTYDQIKITDKTLGETVENKNKIKKLEGIADSNVRVGKSPW